MKQPVWASVLDLLPSLLKLGHFGRPDVVSLHRIQDRLVQTQTENAFSSSGHVPMYRNDFFARTTPIERLAVLHLLNNAFHQIRYAHDRLHRWPALREERGIIIGFTR